MFYFENQYEGFYRITVLLLLMYYIIGITKNISNNVDRANTNNFSVTSKVYYYKRLELYF